MSIQLMDRGEHAIIISDIRHCYGEQGCEEKQIPPTNGYHMKIDLQFHDWKYPVEIQTLSINERLSWGFVFPGFIFFSSRNLFLEIKNVNVEIFPIVEKNILSLFIAIKML
jgi:hypothetical protein